MDNASTPLSEVFDILSAWVLSVTADQGREDQLRLGLQLGSSLRSQLFLDPVISG